MRRTSMRLVPSVSGSFTLAECWRSPKHVCSVVSFVARPWRGGLNSSRRCWDRLLSHGETHCSPRRETQFRQILTRMALWVEVPASSWADHMEYVDGLADKAGARSQLQLEPLQREDDVLGIGLDVHGLSDDEDESLPSQAAGAAPADLGNMSFFSLPPCS
ncbi:hypothetical protein ILYODFUR_038973 [Ilyodon furcidens]|uniref:Uncharacterized protein n=1 Tax=Ilyodon furcidens TaxID=33524 RepID=A0ABV0TEQ9_9TELE